MTLNVVLINRVLGLKHDFEWSSNQQGIRTKAGL